MRWAFAGLFCCSALLGACSLMPSSGPTTSAVSENPESVTEVNGYVVVPLRQDSVGSINRYHAHPSLANSLGNGPVNQGRNAMLVGPGDQIQLRIWEAGDGGIFASKEDRGTRLVTIVSSNGTITIPYGGTIQAAGRTTAQIEAAIVKQLEGKAIQPAASVFVEQNVSNTVIIGGDAARPGRIPLTANSDRITDVIALAGGSRFPPHETEVRIERHSRSARLYLNTLVNGSPDDVRVAAGDRISLVHRPRRFFAFGAVLRTGEITFSSANMSLTAALAQSAGLNDYRADVKGVFLFRREPAKLVTELTGKTYSTQTVPVVYQIDLGNPATFFTLSDIRLLDGDIIYVANAPAAELLKFLQILQGVASNVATGVAVGAGVR